jgi:hypothetical protein
MTERTLFWRVDFSFYQNLVLVKNDLFGG